MEVAAASAQRFTSVSPTPRFVPTQDCEDLATSRLREVLPGVVVTARRLGGIQFVDQGENFERVLCPHCHGTIAMEDWHAWVDRSYSSGFADLAGQTPCCNPSDLNSLTYEWPAGSQVSCWKQ
jgi:hypothetical protein